MEVRARLRHLQASPQKVRLVVDLIRGKGVEEAATILKLTRKSAARPPAKLLRSAVANAENREQGVDVGRLYVREAYVDGVPMLKTRQQADAENGQRLQNRPRAAHGPCY